MLSSSLSGKNRLGWRRICPTRPANFVQQMVRTSPSPSTPIVGPGELSSPFKFPLASPLSALARQTPPSHHRVLDQGHDPPSTPGTPYRPGIPFSNEEPSSPLLHSRFRVSTMTEMSRDDSSYLDSSTTSALDVGYQYHDRDSVYSNVTAMPPSPSAQPAQFWSAAQPGLMPLSNPHVHVQEEEAYADDAFIPSSISVVVSSPDPDPHAMPLFEHRAPIKVPTPANFSRPVRRPPEDAEVQKRLVLERNAGRSSPLHSGPASPAASPQSQFHSTNSQFYGSRTGSRSPSPLMSVTPSTPGHPTPSPSSSQHQPRSLVTHAHSKPNNVLPPPQIFVSPALNVTPDTFALTPLHNVADPPHPSHLTAHDYLLLGIEHHEANRLKESASCFEMSAKEQGGCGVGMVMWGLTLRHGWGCPKNEKQGFKWLQKAAQSAVNDLEKSQGGIDSRAVRVRTSQILACG